MKKIDRIVLSLSVGGIVCCVSAISGISKVVTSHGGLNVAYFQSYLPRLLIALVGLSFLFIAWALSRRLKMAWRLMFCVYVFFWVGLVVGGTQMVSTGYAKSSTRDSLIFAAMLAAVSSPIFIRYIVRWRKHKDYFDAST
jgi:hypothetical protein